MAEMEQLAALLDIASALKCWFYSVPLRISMCITNSAICGRVALSTFHVSFTIPEGTLAFILSQHSRLQNEPSEQRRFSQFFENFLQMIFLACLSICLASTLSPLESSTPSLSSLHIGSSFEEYKAIVAPVMHRVGLLLNDQGQDIIEELTLLIKVDTRNEAIKHFFNYNVPEISSIIHTNNDIILALATSRVSPELLAPLTTVIATYIAKKRAICMFDELPFHFRQAENFSELFTTVDPHAFPVTVASMNGHVTGLPGTAADYNLAYSLDRRFIRYMKPDGSFRFIDTREGCALDVNPGNEVHFVPGTRSLIIRSGTQVSVWHRDSTNTEVLPLADDAILIGIYSNKRVDCDVALIAAVGANIVAVEMSLGDNFSFHVYPENARVAGYGYTELETKGSLTFRDSDGIVLVFSSFAATVLGASKKAVHSLLHLSKGGNGGQLFRLDALLQEDNAIEAWRIIEDMNIGSVPVGFSDYVEPHPCTVLHLKAAFRFLFGLSGSSLED